MQRRKVDEDNRTGGYKERAKKEITAGIIVYRKTSEGPKFLLLYHRGSYWNFPKGHVEREEKSLDAAIRETHEETGLRRSELKLIPNFKTYERFYFRRGKETIFKIVIIYLAETLEPRIKISFEHQGYGWFLFLDARRMLSKYRENQKILEHAYHFINGTNNSLNSREPRRDKVNPDFEAPISGRLTKPENEVIKFEPMNGR